MRRFYIIGATSGLLLIGIMLGAFFAGPLLAQANSVVATPTPKVSKTDQNKYCTQFLEDLAKRLGTTTSKLQEDRQASFNDILDQMVKDGKLTQSEANQIKKNAGAQKGCPGFVHLAGKAFPLGKLVQKYRTDLIAQVAQGLGLKNADALSDQLSAGKSLLDIAKAQNISTDKLRTIVTNAITNELKKAVSAGDLTQAQADQINQNIQKHPQVVDRLLDLHKGKKPSK